jgi:hypothetical protein
MGSQTVIYTSGEGIQLIAKTTTRIFSYFQMKKRNHVFMYNPQLFTIYFFVKICIHITYMAFVKNTEETIDHFINNNNDAIYNFSGDNTIASDSSYLVNETLKIQQVPNNEIMTYPLFLSNCETFSVSLYTQSIPMASGLPGTYVVPHVYELHDSTGNIVSNDHSYDDTTHVLTFFNVETTKHGRVTLRWYDKTLERVLYTFQVYIKNCHPKPKLFQHENQLLSIPLPEPVIITNPYTFSFNRHKFNCQCNNVIKTPNTMDGYVNVSGNHIRANRIKRKGINGGVKTGFGNYNLGGNTSTNYLGRKEGQNGGGGRPARNRF